MSKSTDSAKRIIRQALWDGKLARIIANVGSSADLENGALAVMAMFEAEGITFAAKPKVKS